MKTAKRIMAAAFALVLALAVFAFPASALDGNMSFSLQTNKEAYAPGDNVTVEVYVSSDYNATCMRIPVFYSKDVFELPAGGDIRLTSYGTCLTNKNSLEANTDESETPISIYNVSDYYDDSYGIVAIQWTAGITSSTIKSFNSNGESVKCFSFMLKVKSGASGEGTILIPGADELKPAFAFYNQGVEDASDATTICRVNTTFETGECSVMINAGGEDGITTAPGSDVIIDFGSKIIKNWFDGIDLDIIEENVIPVGNADLQFIASEASGEYGTGTIVRVWSGSNWLGDYNILLYGDVDGNGSVDQVDKSAMSRFVSGLADLAEGDIYTIAADLDLSGEIDQVDLSMIKRYVSGLIELDQSL